MSTFTTKYTGSKYNSAKPMYEHQSKLLMLPVPKLEDTKEKYLRSIQPLNPPKEHLALAEQFFTSEQSASLQQRLLEKADVEGK